MTAINGKFIQTLFVELLLNAKHCLGYKQVHQKTNKNIKVGRKTVQQRGCPLHYHDISNHCEESKDFKWGTREMLLVLFLVF